MMRWLRLHLDSTVQCYQQLMLFFVVALKEVKRFSKPNVYNYTTLRLDEDEQILYVGAREAVFALLVHDVTKEVKEACSECTLQNKVLRSITWMKNLVAHDVLIQYEPWSMLKFLFEMAAVVDGSRWESKGTGICYGRIILLSLVQLFMTGNK
eukprot:g44635.t1